MNGDARPGALPSGLATFLFTDIEGSTRRWEADPEVMRAALAALRAGRSPPRGCPGPLPEAGTPVPALPAPCPGHGVPDAPGASRLRCTAKRWRRATVQRQAQPGGSR
jgi:hypothetical protein